MKRKFKQWLSTIPSTSTKQILGQAQKYGLVWFYLNPDITYFMQAQTLYLIFFMYMYWYCLKWRYRITCKWTSVLESYKIVRLIM